MKKKSFISSVAAILNEVSLDILAEEFYRKQLHQH